MSTENRLMPAASGECYWRDPKAERPPLAVKMLLLTSGGVAILGSWSWNSNLVAWAPLPRRHQAGVPASIMHESLRYPHDSEGTPV
jgi:hypothetical protein